MSCEEIHRRSASFDQLRKNTGTEVPRVAYLSGLKSRSFPASRIIFYEQSQGAQQISEAMEHLSQASQQTAGSLRETNHALEELDEATHSLKTEIARFKVMA